MKKEDKNIYTRVALKGADVLDKVLERIDKEAKIPFMMEERKEKPDAVYV